MCGQLRGDLYIYIYMKTSFGDSSGSQRNGNISCWKPVPGSTVKTVTQNTSNEL
jgi:hypothetical protein